MVKDRTSGKLYTTLQSGEGFSIRATLDVYAGNGYAVGGANKCQAFERDNESLSLIEFRQVLNRFIFSCVDNGGQRTQVIGGWVCDEGVAYIEISDVVASKSVALELAKARGEKAIYDFENAKSIYL